MKDKEFDSLMEGLEERDVMFALLSKRVYDIEDALKHLINCLNITNLPDKVNHD